jgi:SAM-dependent methyltransferase
MPGAETFRTSAEAYDRHIGRYGPSLAEGLVGLARIAPGMRALDVGCGPGALTAALADRLGAAAVTGAEPSEPFAAACRAWVPGARVVVAAAESLPFPDGAFDAALCQLVVNFMRDPVAGVREMARVTRPGGVVAACVWDYAGGMTLLRAFWDAARDVDPVRAARADEGATMPWCGEGDLVRLWGVAGLQGVRPAVLEARAGYDGFDDLWAALPSGVAPSGAFCASLDRAGRDALRRGLRDRLGVGGSPFTLTARAFAVTGVVPPAGADPPGVTRRGRPGPRGGG